MTTDLDRLLADVDPSRMAATVAALARSSLPERVEAATLAAVCRLVVATVWLATMSDARFSSLIGD